MSNIMENIRAQMRWDCRPEASECWCRGSGWIYTDWDSHHECPYHYRGQPHPEDDDHDFWYDTLEARGGGQFPLIPSDETDAERYERDWRHWLDRLERMNEDLPF